jgi:Domain of unknown function (DUF4160)
MAKEMPEIVRLSNCKICVYPGDHLPAHFHVRGSGWNVSISMNTLLLLKGKGPKADIMAAIEWASVPDNRVRLLSEWRRLNERD